MGKAQALITTERDNISATNRFVISFYVSFQFRAIRLALLAVMSLHSKRYDMIAHLTYNLGVAQS